MIACSWCGSVRSGGAFEWVLVSFAAVVTLGAVVAAIRYTLRPGEADPEHVKRRILLDRDDRHEDLGP